MEMIKKDSGHIPQQEERIHFRPRLPPDWRSTCAPPDPCWWFQLIKGKKTSASQRKSRANDCPPSCLVSAWNGPYLNQVCCFNEPYLGSFRFQCPLN